MLDGESPHQFLSPHPGAYAANIWETTGPADNSGNEDATLPRMRGDALPMIRPAGSRLILLRIPGGIELAEKGLAHKDPWMHASAACEYVIVVKGAATLVLDTGKTQLGAGDILVQRGVIHDVVNESDDEVVLVIVMLDAAPLVPT